MISSGIKRGLASTAVAALAVAGIPFLASSASAAPNDTLAVASQGPIRNTNAAGGSVVVKSNATGLLQANMRVTSADFSTNPMVPIGPGNEISSSAFDVNVISFTQLDGDTSGGPGDLGPADKFADGTYHYNVQTAVTLGTATKATFGLVEDAAPTGGAANASDPKTVIEITPTGAPATVDVSSATPATAVGNPVKFDVSVKDAAGNVTQVIGTEEFDVTHTAGMFVAAADLVLDATDLANGTTSFNGTPTAGGTQSVTVTGSTPPAATITDTQSVTVFENADITTDEFAFNTGADTWVDGTTAFGSPVQVRVDQNSVTFNIASKDGVDADTAPDDAGKVVGLLLTSATIKFDGKTGTGAAPYVVPILLGSDGKGTATVALSNVVENSTWTFQAPGSFGPGAPVAASTVTMARPTPSSVAPDAGVYVTKIGSPTSVTVTLKDQFGNPIGAPAQVSITRGARNGGTTTARSTVDANGKATISLPDAGTVAGQEVFTINRYDDQFDATATNSAGGTINYTADGLGGDFTVAGVTATASATVIRPLTDAVVNGSPAAQEAASITVAGGTDSAPVTVTVDNGALILKGAETNLTQGSASDTITLNGAGTNVGAPTQAVTIVGTKTGVVNVTVASGGRTKTYALTVTQDPATVAASARNVEVTAPESAKAGEVAVFDVKVTDAFGNPVAGFGVGGLNLIPSGPANIQSSDPSTGNDGVLHVNVILTDNANSQVSLRAIGTGSQFGSKANEVNGVPAPGLTVSVSTDTATVTDVVNIAELQAAVDAAQAKVDLAQDNLDTAKGNLSVAKAQRSVAQSNVKAAKKDLKAAKKQHKGVKAAQAALRNAKGDLKIAKAQVDSAQGQVDRAKERLATAQAELAAAQQALEDAQS